MSDFEEGEIGADLFRPACLMGLEGLVSKRSNRAYRDGSPNWVKIKNPGHPAMRSVNDAFDKSTLPGTRRNQSTFTEEWKEIHGRKKGIPQGVKSRQEVQRFSGEKKSGRLAPKK